MVSKPLPVRPDKRSNTIIKFSLIAGEQHVIKILHDLYHFFDRSKSSLSGKQCEDFLTVVWIFVNQCTIPPFRYLQERFAACG